MAKNYLKIFILFFSWFFCAFFTFLLPAIANSPPTLSSPSFDGNGAFSVIYTDPDNDPPVLIKVQRRGPVGTRTYDYDLDPENPNPTSFDKGVRYIKTISLPQGSYTYQFFANDGTYDAVKAEGAPDAGITEAATFTLDHEVPTASASDGSGGCSLTQPNLNNFKIGSLFFLMSVGFLFLRRKRVKN